MFDGKLLGLQYDSRAVDDLDGELYTDLGNSLGVEGGLASRFVQFYSPACLHLIDSVLEGKDDAAFEMFHSSVREAVGREAFDSMFKMVREKCGTEQKIELETFLTEEDKDGTHFFKIGHRVSGGEVPQVLTASFQIVGMKAALVSVSIAPADPSDDARDSSDRPPIAPPSENDDAPAAPTVEPPVPAPPRLE